MLGKCSSGSTPSSGKFRLPSPIFAVPDKHLSSQSEVQRNEIGQNSGYPNDLNNPKFSQSNNQWTSGGAPGQSNRKERFAKPNKPKFQSPRNSYNAYKPRGRGSSSFYCDSCDRGFSTHEEFQYHISNEHVTCGLDGCTLSAHPKVVEKHQKIQHLSGLYLRLMSNSSKNPEDVSKWIAERKKNYPTRANIERRKEVDKERLERGETLEPDRRRFGRFGGRIQQRGSQRRGGKGIQRDRRHPRTQSKEGGVPRGKRGRGRSGPWKISERIFHQKTEKSTAKEEIESEWEDKKGIPMFCGTAILFGTPLKKEESSDEEIVGDEVEFSDSEWQLEDGAAKCKDAIKDENCASADGNLSNPKKDTVVLNNALGLLIGTYGSDDSNSDEEDSKAESKPPAKRVCMGDKSDNQLKPLSVTTEKKTEVISLPSNTLTVETVNVEEDCDGSGPEVVYTKKAPIENVISSNKVADEIVTVEDESNDSAPEVVSIKRVSKEEVGIANEDEKRDEKEDDKIESEGRKRARRSRKRGRTRGERGGKRDGKKGLEEEDGTEEAGAEDEGRAARERKQKELNQPQRYPTLLEELLKDEIRHERNAILQCIRYAVENNFFDKVEEISPTEVVPEDESASNGDSKNKSLEMLSVNELQSVSNGSNNDVMITVSVEGKIENIASLSGNHDCEMEEPNSCRIDGQKGSDVVKGTSHDMESSSQECEGTEKMVLEKESSSNNPMSQAVNDSQSTSNCSRKDISNSNKTDGRSSEISQLESKDSMKYQNSSIANNENVSVVKKSKSSKKVDSALQEKEKSLEQKTSKRETENLSLSSMSTDVQLTNNVYQNDEVVSKGKHNENSALVQDKGLTEEHKVSRSISAEGDLKKTELTSIVRSEDEKNTESLQISPEENHSNVAKFETKTDIKVEESKGMEEVVQFLIVKNSVHLSDEDLKPEKQECD